MLFQISFSSKISPAFNSNDVLPETLFTSLLKPLFFLDSLPTLRHSFSLPCLVLSPTALP